MIKQTLLLAILFTHSFLFSQKTKTNAKSTILIEQILLQTNTDFYLAGESVYYKTICVNAVNKAVSATSKIAYIELINETNIAVLKHKQVVQNGISYNDFFLPTTLETGNYKIVSYTNQTKNRKEYASKEVFIYNPYLPFPDNFKENSETSLGQNISNTTNNAVSNSKINTNRFEYKRREQVTINNTENLKGQFVLNVYKIDSIPTLEENKVSFITNIEELNPEIPSEKKEKPETRGEVFSGTILPKTTTDKVEGKKIALSIPGDPFDFKITTTDKNGNFDFVLDHVTGENAYVQIFENDKENYKVTLFEQPGITTNPTKKKLKINPNYAQAFLKRSIANQIQNVYYHTKSDTVFAFKKNNPFYSGADKEYVLKDYTPQNTVKEIFIEIIPEVYTYKKNGKQIINVNNFHVKNSEIYLNTLVLVDGFLLQDVDELLTYDPAFFTKINFVNKGYFLNKYIFNGVVNLTTKDLNFVPNLAGDYIIKKELIRPQLNKKYFNMDYSKSGFENIPDYRYQLCWEPNITEISKEHPLSFYTSDIPGNYRIRVEGITENGELLEMENYITVK